MNRLLITFVASSFFLGMMQHAHGTAILGPCDTSRRPLMPIGGAVELGDAAIQAAAYTPFVLSYRIAEPSATLPATEAQIARVGNDIEVRVFASGGNASTDFGIPSTLAYSAPRTINVAGLAPGSYRITWIDGGAGPSPCQTLTVSTAPPTITVDSVIYAPTLRYFMTADTAFLNAASRVDIPGPRSQFQRTT
jgi:hypothetical protein